MTEDIREWDYGEYEGLTTAQIRAQRHEKGLSENWSIWRDGCPGGESPADVTKRLDRLIADLRTRFHAPAIGRTEESAKICDVLVVAHGHILRAFAMRWIGREFHTGVNMMLEAGGIGTLSYEHHNVQEPAIMYVTHFLDIY